MRNLLCIATIIATSVNSHATNMNSSNQYYGSQIANCGGDFTNVNAALYPSNTLETGEEAFIYTEYTSPYEVDNGYVLTSINFNGVPYPEFNTSLCSNGESGISKFLRSPFKYFHLRAYEKVMGIDCPIKPGNFAKNSSFTVPNDIGTLRTKIGWFSDTGRLLLCLKIVVDIVAPNQVHHEI